MGVPLPGRAHKCKEDLLPQLPDLSERSIRSLSGNAMHTAVIGTLLMGVLCTVQPVHQHEPEL